MAGLALQEAGASAAAPGVRDWRPRSLPSLHTPLRKKTTGLILLLDYFRKSPLRV